MTELKPVIRVCVTGAAGQIGYSLVPMIASGIMFGYDQPLILTLLDIPPGKPLLDGLVMELHDSSYPLVVEFIPTTDPVEAFADIDYGVFVGAFPRKDGMSRADLLGVNGKIFMSQGKMLEAHAKKTVKCVVVGNPANTNCLLLSHFAPSIPKRNFTSLSRLDFNRARYQIARKVGVSSMAVVNNISWGNHSRSQVPDVDHGYILGKDGEKTPIREAVKDDAWLDGEFSDFVKKRGGVVLRARGKSSATSAAKAACDHMHDWVRGTKEGRWVAMGVPSDGSYGVPEGVVFSMPVRCKDGEYEIVKGLELSSGLKKLVQVSCDELFAERAAAFALIPAAK